MTQDVESEIHRLVSVLKSSQSVDGSWNDPFETGISTDSYMIILLRTLDIHEEDFIHALVRRILSKQKENGAWTLFEDEEGGNVSATIEAYYGLLYSGYVTNHDDEMIAARHFILSRGGVEQAGMFTKVMLALTGQYAWPTIFPVPIELILLPPSFPIDFYDFSIYGRANFTPILIVGNKKFQIKTKHTPDLSDLFTHQDIRNKDDPIFNLDRAGERRHYFSPIITAMKAVIDFPEKLERIAYEQAMRYMLDRIEPDGTFYSYFSSTFLMVFALLSLGYPKHHPTIIHAVQGLKSMACTIDGYIHMQYTTAHVWNTSLISYSLQEAGVSEKEEVIQKANQYLLSRQHHKYGDWVIHNPFTLPGGWGFSHINTINPDVDDTTVSLRSLSRFIMSHPKYHQAWDRGINWVLSMQNDDGGWPAFEKNVDKKIIRWLPVQDAEFILLDPSTADLTGRTLEFLGHFTHLNHDHPVIKDGIKWLKNDQNNDGSWYGRWGICYIYGTWAALTGMMACGVRKDSKSIKKAIEWLKSIQNRDGGWGESCYSDIKRKYVPLGESTLTHTSWAVDALIAASDEATPEIRRGIDVLLQHGNKQDWTTKYPKGQGMPGSFYIHYHSYRFIWPLLTLSHYKKKFFNVK